MDLLPMKNSNAYPEQLTLKVSIDTKQTLKVLKEHGVDVAELCRQVINQALELAVKKVETNK